MKKVYSLVFLLSFLFFGIHAAVSQSFNGGLILGGITSQVDGDRYAGFHQFGLTAGAYVNLPLENHFSLQMELKYSQMGAHSDVKEVVQYGYNPFSLRFHYAEVPLMLRYDLGFFNINGKMLDFIVLELGVSADVLLKSQESADYEPEYESSHWRLFSMTGNAGLHFDLSEHWGFGVRGMYSIIPIRFTASPGWFYGHYYNKVLQATVTYNINASGR